MGRGNSPHFSAMAVDDRDVRNLFNRLPRVTREGLAKGVSAANLFFIKEAQSLIRSSPATGREYPRGAKTHVASSPGQAPRSDTGRLIGSFGQDVRIGPAKIIGTISANVEYAESLEFGTTRMAERPFMRPTLLKTQDTLQKIMGKAWSRELQKLRKAS